MEFYGAYTEHTGTKPYYVPVMVLILIREPYSYSTLCPNIIISKDPHSLHCQNFIPFAVLLLSPLHHTTPKILRPKNTGRGRGDMRQVLQLPVQGGG
jgi:hypothetical protein